MVTIIEENQTEEWVIEAQCVNCYTKLRINQDDVLVQSHYYQYEGAATTFTFYIVCPVCGDDLHHHIEVPGAVHKYAIDKLRRRQEEERREREEAYEWRRAQEIEASKTKRQQRDQREAKRPLTWFTLWWRHRG